MANRLRCARQRDRYDGEGDAWILVADVRLTQASARPVSSGPLTPRTRRGQDPGPAVSDASDVTPADGWRIPLSAPVVAGNEWAYVKECLDDAWVAGGRFIGLFEERIRDVTGSEHAVACVNGTAALHLALLAAGIGPGDEVIVPSLTFIAPVNAVRYVGAEPVFLGCDDFMNLDPEAFAAFCAEECEPVGGGLRDRATGRRLRAVMPVHVFGNPCDMVAIGDTARRHGLAVIEDASESLGSRWTSGPLAGRHTGTVSDSAALSFNGNKIVTCGGGGVLLTQDDETAKRVRYLATQAKDDPVRYVHGEVGYNYRLTNVAAAIGSAQLEALPDFLRTKRANHALYAELLDGIPGLRLLGMPEETEANLWFYSLVIEPDRCGTDREAVMGRLARKGIQTRPVWLPNHMQVPYRECRSYRVDRAVWFWERVLNLPCGSGLGEDEVRRACIAIRAVL
jgi:perosamine synthetase